METIIWNNLEKKGELFYVTTFTDREGALRTGGNLRAGGNQ